MNSKLWKARVSMNKTVDKEINKAMKECGLYDYLILNGVDEAVASQANEKATMVFQGLLEKAQARVDLQAERISEKFSKVEKAIDSMICHGLHNFVK